MGTDKIDRLTDRQTETQTDRRTDRHADRHTCKSFRLDRHSESICGTCSQSRIHRRSVKRRCTQDAKVH